jgi:hypothetical protein
VVERESIDSATIQAAQLLLQTMQLNDALIAATALKLLLIPT